MGAFIRFVKSNLLKCISLVLLVILVLFFAGFLAHPAGKQLFDMLLSNFPFSAFIYKQYCAITGNEIENTVISETSFLFDTVKTFSGSIIKCILMTVAARIFLYIPLPVNQIISSPTRRDAIDILEEETRKPLYVFKYSVISAIVTLIAVFLGNGFMDWVDDIVGKHHIFLYIICAALYAAFSFLRSKIAGISVMDSLRVSFFFNVLPNAITLLGTTGLILYAHYSYKADGFNWVTVVLCWLLLFWCALSEFLCNELRRWCAGLYMDKRARERKYSIRFSVFLASAFFYSAYSVMFVVGMEGKPFSNEWMRILFNVSELPFIHSGGEGLQVFSSFEAFGAWIYPETVKLLLFVLTVAFLQMLCTQTRLIPWYFFQCSLIFTLTLLVYSILLYAINVIPAIWLLVAAILIVSVMYFSRISLWRKGVECLLAAGGLLVASLFIRLFSSASAGLNLLFAAMYLLILNIIFAIAGLLENRKHSNS